MHAHICQWVWIWHVDQDNSALHNRTHKHTCTQHTVRVYKTNACMPKFVTAHICQWAYFWSIKSLTFLNKTNWSREHLCKAVTDKTTERSE